MSGYENIGTGDKLGAGSDRLQKPFSLSTLLERVRRLLDTPMPGGKATTSANGNAAAAR
jgi:DNA-binding response OmpR family regulator